MKKLLLTLAVPFACLGSFGLVSAHGNHNNQGNCQAVTDTEIDVDNTCVYVCHQSEDWIVKHELKSYMASGDFLYAGPTNDNGHPNKDAPYWCKDNVPTPPEPSPVTPPTPTPESTPTPSPAPKQLDETPPPVNTLQGK